MDEVLVTQYRHSLPASAKVGFFYCHGGDNQLMLAVGGRGHGEGWEEPSRIHDRPAGKHCYPPAARATPPSRSA